MLLCSKSCFFASIETIRDNAPGAEFCGYNCLVTGLSGYFRQAVGSACNLITLRRP